MRTSALRKAAVFALMACVSAPRGWAWGREGHRLTALVAESYLTPETRAAVAELLGKETMAGVASWADEYRTQHPETGKWHFADTPAEETAYNRDRDCPASPDTASPWRDCVVDRIIYFEARLGDRALPQHERYEALKYLIHFIGDIHQPLHVIGGARGGNDIHVSFLGSDQCGSYRCNLHGVWDDSMIEHRDLPEKKYVAYLLADIQEHDWEKLAGGTPVKWANASHKYAADAFAPNGALISREYVAEESKIVDAQLALGGLRLARVLNSILSGQQAPPAAVATDPARVPLAKPDAPKP